MSEFLKIVLTVLGTVLSGTIVLVIGQLLVKSVIEPFQQLRIVISNTSLNVMVYEDVFSNPDKHSEDEIKEARKQYKLLAYDLEAKMSVIIGYRYFSKYKLLPRKRFVYKARDLILEIANPDSKKIDELLMRKNIHDIKFMLGLGNEFLMAERLKDRLNADPRIRSTGMIVGDVQVKEDDEFTIFERIARLLKR